MISGNWIQRSCEKWKFVFMVTNMKTIKQNVLQIQRWYRKYGKLSKKSFDRRTSNDY